MYSSEISKFQPQKHTMCAEKGAGWNIFPGKGLIMRLYKTRQRGLFFQKTVMILLVVMAGTHSVKITKILFFQIGYTQHSYVIL